MTGELNQFDALMEKIKADPDARKSFVRIAKKVEPDWQVPVDVAVDDLRAETKAELAEIKRQAETDRINADLERKRAALAERYGADAVKAIETDIMTKYGLVDYELAGRVYAAEQPAPDRERRDPAVSRHGATWQMPELNMKAYLDNPRKAALDEAYRCVDEFSARK